MPKFMTLKDHVYQYIADQIRDGKLLADAKIDEKVICEELNISRTPVREALIQLASEGILTNNTHRGFVVRALTATDLKQLYGVIGILDGAAASEACSHISESDINDMRFYLDSMDLAITSGNFDMYQKQQKLFHQVYIDKCGNDILIDSIESLKKKLLNTNYNKVESERVKAILSQTNGEHRKILELLTAGDKDEVFKYIAEIHWKPDYVEFEMLRNCKTPSKDKK